MDEDQQHGCDGAAVGPEAPATAEAAMGQPAANAPQYAYQNQPAAVNTMGVAVSQQPTNAPQFAYQNQPIMVNNPMGVATGSQPAGAPQFIYMKPNNNVVNQMEVAGCQQPSANAPQYVYQIQPTVGNNAPQYVYQNQNQQPQMGVAMSQPANAPQYVLYQNQPTAVSPMGVAVSQQPPANNTPQFAYHNQQNVVNGQFSIGLLDCFSDPSLCCLTFWCPCITFGRVAEIVDRGSSSCGTSGAIYAIILACTYLQFIYSCTYRQKMRAQFGMAEDAIGDFCIHFWCEVCALVQEHRELQIRGYDLALGWNGNMARQNNQVVLLPPPVPSGMIR